MRRVPPVGLLLLATFVPGGVRGQDSAETVARRLGSAIEGSNVDAEDASVDWGRAVAVVDAPFEEVRRVVLDYGHYHKFLPHFEQSRVLSRRGESALVYLEATVLRGSVTLWAKMRLGARRRSDGTHIVEAKMLDGNMRYFSARWELTPLDGGRRSLVAFQILIAPGLPLPPSVFSNENRKSAVKTLRALRRRVRV